MPIINQSNSKPFATLSLDLDNLWSYLKTAGRSGWEDYPGYFDVVVPRILEFLDRHRLTITFFIVGQDATLSRNEPALRMISDAGHEIGNHSFNHDAIIGKSSYDVVDRELELAEDAISNVTGQKPLGFRGPSFAISATLLTALRNRGYRYDASTFPTFFGPVARYYYFRNSSLSEAERREQSLLFGKFADGRRPLKPYKWNIGETGLLEIPVSTIPLIRAPFHITYLSYLAGLSPALARRYFGFALAVCRFRGIEPSLLLHPLDFLGSDDVDSLASFPGMQQTSADKLTVLDDVIGTFKSRFQVLPMLRYAEKALLNRRLDTRPNLPAPEDLGKPADVVSSLRQ